MPSPTATYLITGSSRGIGLALVEGLLKGGATVIATCRDPSASPGLCALKGTSRLAILPLDVMSLDSIRRAAEQVMRLFPEGIDVLINNAAACQTVETCTILEGTDEDAERILGSNALGPIRMIRVFFPLLKLKAAERNGLILNMSSRIGSITSPVPKATVYSGSKAALNMMSVLLSWEFKQRGIDIPVLSMHPGWVNTAMGDTWELNSPLMPAESAQGIIEVIQRPGAKLDAKFLDHLGEEQPW